MRKAIDNYAQGKQREVEAWIGSSISASSGRFICPECLENVALDVRGHFRHKNRTAQSLECDKRVDSSSRSAYERMGLPLFLCNDDDTTFSLAIGFSGHDEESLDRAASVNAYFDITERNRRDVRYSISYARFTPNTITLIPIDYIPNGNGAFQLRYSDNTPQKLKNVWTNHTDNWGSGQFFKISEKRSRKIRSLGTIVTDEDYYYIGGTWAFNSYASFVKITKVGALKLADQTLTVHRINIKKSHASEYQFKAFADLLRNRYKVNLLVGESLLLPIWPPCIEQDSRMIYPKNTSSVQFYVQTPNESPTIYRYHGGSYVREDVRETAPYTYRLSLTGAEIPLCVDRVFNGNIQFICRSSIETNAQMLEADIIDETGTSVNNSPPTALRHKVFTCLTNFPATVHIHNDGLTDCCRDINSADGLLLDKCHWGDTISIYTRSGNLVYTYTFQKTKTNCEEADSDFIEKFKQSCHGPTERLTPQIIALFKSIHNNTVRDIVKKYIRQGIIPTSTVSLLLRHARRK